MLPSPDSHFEVTELIFEAELGESEQRLAVERVAQGSLRYITPGVLTSIPETEWPALVKRHLVRFIAAMLPGAVYGFQTAFNGGQLNDGLVFVTHATDRVIQLPGLILVAIRGSGALPGDNPVQNRTVYFPSEARTLLENLRPNRGRWKPAVGRAAVETRLVRMLTARGRDALVQLRDTSARLAPLLHMEAEHQALNAILGALLGERSSRLCTPSGRGLTAREPFDVNRLTLLQTLGDALRAAPLPSIPGPDLTQAAKVNFAFLESYFSNFIEGVEFDVPTAKAIVLAHREYPERHQDAQDLLGVFQQAVHSRWRAKVLPFGLTAVRHLQRRHAALQGARPEVRPGELKTTANRAGMTEFVAPCLVKGTLQRGTRLLGAVPPGLARALLAMALVTEVHPFNDGNGRLARLMMNAELSAAGMSRIIIPTLFRDEYLDCLRLLSREGDPRPFITAMQKIQEWTTAFDYEDLDAVIEAMAQCHAFEKSRINFKLLLPSQRS